MDPPPGLELQGPMAAPDGFEQPLQKEHPHLQTQPDWEGRRGDGPSSGSDELDSPNNMVQRLFQRHLGPPLALPEEIRASCSSQGDAWREKERLSFKVANGQALDYQAVPASRTLLGLHFQPPRQLPHRRPAASPPPRQPVHAALWALVQPADSLGVNTALNAVGEGPSGFGGWHQSGFWDVSRRAGVDFSLSRHAAGDLEAEVELSAKTPKLPLLPQLTARHRVLGRLQAGRLQHCSAVSAPLLGGAAVAKLEVREAAASAAAAGAAASGAGAAAGGGATVTLELQSRGKGSRGLAGGAKVQADLESNFYSGRGSGSLALAPDSSSSSSSSSSDSDDEGGDKARQRQQLWQRVPGLRLEVVPQAARGWQDVSGRWQQAWGGGLRSAVSYQGKQQQRWQLDVAQKLGSWLTASVRAAGEGPPDLSALALAAHSGGDAGGGSHSVSQRLRRLSAHVHSYASASRLGKAALKLSCRLQRPVRRLHWEFSYDAGGAAGRAEVAHELGYRLGGGRGDYTQQKGRCELLLRAKPRSRELHVQLEFFAPL